MTALRVVAGDTGEVTLDRLSSISQKSTRCPFGAPIGAIINDGTPRLYQTCCNHWNCPVCWRKMAARVRERIIYGAVVLAAMGYPLFFWTFTCRGRDLALEDADDGYYEWTNRALANLRYKAGKQKQPWVYVQVTERQQRGHAHSHFIHTFAPDDAEVFQDRKGRFTLSSASFLSAVVDAGLGPQCQITVIDSPEKVAIYISGYLKKHINSDTFPAHWRRVRWSQHWPGLPKLVPVYAGTLRSKNDFYQADKMKVDFVAETEEIYNYARRRMIHVAPPIG